MLNNIFMQVITIKLDKTINLLFIFNNNLFLGLYNTIWSFFNDLFIIIIIMYTIKYIF